MSSLYDEPLIDLGKAWHYFRYGNAPYHPSHSFIYAHPILYWISIAVIAAAAPYLVWRFPGIKVEAARLINLMEVKKDHIFTCPQAVVAYRTTGSIQKIDDELTKIFSANPNIDPRPLATTLGIEIVNFQPTQAAKPAEPVPTKKPGVTISFHE